MNTDLTITVDKSYTSGLRLVLQGRVTSASANILQHKLEQVFGENHKIVILDMRQVNYLSSGGIRVLLMFYKEAKKAGGSFQVQDPSENVINVLGMTNLNEMLLK